MSGELLLCPALVGRDRERALLLERVEAALAGKGGVTALVGDAGTGKTRLVREMVDHAGARGMRVLTGRCVPAEVPTPYRPLTEAFVRTFRSKPAGEPASSLVGFGGQVHRLVPGWHLADDEPTGADESPVLLGEAVVRLLGLLAGEAGCLLVLEDLHWADPETIAVVDYLVDGLREERVLTAFTTRPVGATVELLPRLHRRESALTVQLSPLESHEIEQVVNHCLATEAAPAEVVDFIAAQSDGVPFLIEELLAGLLSGGALENVDGRWVSTETLKPSVPFSLRDSIRRRLATLDDTARRVLGAAAVLGRRFEWELVPSVAGVDGASAVEALRRGIGEQLIEVDGQDFKFRHALTREVVVSELLPPELRDFARRAWPAIERAHPGLPGPWCEHAAELAEAAGEAAAAAALFVLSARRALASGALTSAEVTVNHARLLAASPEADQLAAEILALAGKPAEAAAIAKPLIENLPANDASADQLCDLLIVLARAALAAGDSAEAQEYVTRLATTVDCDHMDAAATARVDAMAAHVAFAHVRIEEASARAESAVRGARATAQPAVECEALEVLAQVARLDNVEAAIAYYEQAAAVAEKHGLSAWLIRARQNLALFDWIQGKPDSVTEVRNLALRHGALVTVAHLDLALADFALSEFDTEACRAAAERCVNASRRYNLSALPVAELWSAGACALAGDREGMEAAAQRALARDPADPRILGDLWGRVRATLAIVENDRATLRDCLDRQMEYVRIAPVTTSVFPNRPMWALLSTIDDPDMGSAARAAIRGADNLTLLANFDGLRALADAVAAGRAGRHEEAAAVAAAADAALLSRRVESGVVQFHRLLVAEAAQRDGWGDPVSLARGAEIFFAERGFDRVAEACRKVIANAGAPLSRRRSGDAMVPPPLRALGVTAREFEVLGLVVEGHTNRAIGERLFLSSRTVDRHVSNLFDRCGVRTRAELAEFARHKLGSPPPPFG